MPLSMIHVLDQDLAQIETYLDAFEFISIGQETTDQLRSAGDVLKEYPFAQALLAWAITKRSIKHVESMEKP